MSDFEQDFETFASPDGWVMFKPVNIPFPLQIVGGDMLDIVTAPRSGAYLGEIELNGLSGLEGIEAELLLPIEPYEQPNAETIIKSGASPIDIVAAIKAAMEQTHYNA